MTRRRRKILRRIFVYSLRLFSEAVSAAQFTLREVRNETIQNVQDADFQKVTYFILLFSIRPALVSRKIRSVTTVDSKGKFEIRYIPESMQG